MTHEIRYHQIDIAELDAFLEEYDALCKKHGMAFEAQDYDSGGCFMTIVAPTASGSYLNLDRASDDVPCIARARREAAALSEAEHQERRAAEQIERGANDQREFARLKKKYGA